MTMSLSLRHLPEVQAARDTLRAASNDALPNRTSRLARLAVFLIMFASGVGICSAALYFGWMVSPDKDFWRTCIMVLAILSGFIITTMVFTGKIESASLLSYSELRTVTLKSTHLLLYQLVTLVNHLCCIGVVFLVPAFTIGNALLADGATAIAIGLMAVSMWRSILIPIKIIELHRFTHAALLRAKGEDAKKVAATL